VNENEPAPSPLALALGFMNIGLTSVGGAAGPLRHVVVKQRKWLSENGLAEIFGVAQALPGATVVNVAVMFADRSAGPAGVFAALAGLCIPSLILALLLATVATHISATNVRFAAAEVAVTAAVGGVFLSNGARLIAMLWRDGRPDVPLALRCARLAISALGILLVAGLHLWIPYAVVILVALGIAVERRINQRAAVRP